MDEGEGRGLTLRDLVLEIRTDVRKLDEKITQIDRHGSIGTREVISDHESRVRSLERWKYGIPMSILIAIGTSTAIVLRALGV